MPSIVGADNSLPLWSHGGQSCSDQLYVDSLGRLTVVEVKKDIAGVDALVQLLGNSEHARFLSTEALSSHFVTSGDRFLESTGAAVVALTRPGLAAEAVVNQSKLSSTRAKTAEIEQRLGAPGLLRELGIDAARRLHPDGTGYEAWISAAKPDLAGAVAHAGAAALTLRGAPPRLVLVAPSFNDDCLALAKKLVARWIDVRLVALKTYQVGGGDRVEWHVSFEPVVLARHIETAWRAIDVLWRMSDIRDSYLPPTWYLGKDSALPEFALRREPRASFTIGVTPEVDVASIFTRVPHGMAEADPEKRKQLSRKLKAALPAPQEESKGDFVWNFKLPSGNRMWLKRAHEVALAIRNVFVGGS